MSSIMELVYSMKSALNINMSFDICFREMKKKEDKL